MTRRLVVLLLLHHIEGVCKPWSAATLAARRILAGFVEHVAGRDQEAAIKRAQERQAAAVERAHGRRELQRRDREAGHRERPRRALGRGVPVEGWAQQVRDRREERR